jgi:hypothetical protein
LVLKVLKVLQIQLQVHKELKVLKDLVLEALKVLQGLKERRAVVLGLKVLQVQQVLQDHKVLKVLQGLKDHLILD